MTNGLIVTIMMNELDHIQDDLEQQLRQEEYARAELEREVELLHRFISAASHDLRNPISTLKTSLYLIQRKPELATDDRMAIMEGQLERLSHLVNAMSLMSRLDGKSQLAYDETDIMVVIHEALWVVDEMVKANNIQMSLETPQHIPQVSINFEEFKRALVNLLDNAIRYTAKGGNVTIKLSEMHGYLCVDVVDTGKGLSDTEVSHLFERFYRGDDTGDATDTGAGMGLAIVKRIIELHGGKIRVTTEQNVGSTFRLMLPI